LAEQRKETRPWIIGDVGTWAQIDAIPGGDQAEIELGVLVVRESFVISSDRAKSVCVHQGVMAMIHKSSLCQPAVGRPSVAQLGILCRSRGFLETCRAPCGHAYHDRLGVCHLLRRKQCSTKVDGIIGMGINPDYEGSQIAILLNRSVDPATLYPPNVAEKNNSIVAARTLLDYSYCSIRAPAIRNDDLSNLKPWLRREMIYNALDVAFLVQARNDDDGTRR
jgi:hypothetical protein